MSTLGFAIFFYVCASGSQDCQKIDVRASRFVDLRQCQATVVEAVRQARRSRGDGTSLIAACRDLDDVCAPTLTRLRPLDARQSSLLQQAHHSPRSAPVDGPLAILCTKPPQTDCGT